MLTKAKKSLLVSLSALLCVMLLAFGLSTTSIFAHKTANAADDAKIVVNGTEYATFEQARDAATPDDNGVITYTVFGTNTVSSTDAWIQVVKEGLSNVNAVKFVGNGEGAELVISNPTSVFADQKYDLDVSFENLTLSHPNGAWVDDLGHATNYFATLLRNTNAKGNTVTYTNCKFPNGVCNNSYGNTVFTECVFNNETTGKYNLWVYGGSVEVNNSSFSGARGVKTYTENTNLEVVETELSLNEVSFSEITEKAAVVVSKAANVAMTAVDVENCEKGLLQKDIGTATTITANGTGVSGTFSVVNNTDAAEVKNELNITGGTFTSEVSSDYCADGFTVTDKGDGTYGVSEETLTPDENNVYHISTESQLIMLAEMVNEKGETFIGKTVVLENDIELTKAWTSIGSHSSGKMFKGTFDGQNHTISGMNIVKYNDSGVGFFGKAYQAKIQNLTVEGSVTAYGCNYVGGIVGHGYATITNCTFRGTVGDEDMTSVQVGGIAGSGGFTITNCSVYGDVSASTWAGGIVGNCQDGGAYTNCYVEGVISSKSTYWGGGAAGITPVPLLPAQVISGCYSNTVVKVAGEEVNCPIIASYNNPLNYDGYAEDIKIYDNSWNKEKNNNDSYPVYAEQDGEGGVLQEGKTVSRDKNVVALESELQYVDCPLSEVRFMGSLTAAQVENATVAAIGEEKYFSLTAAIAAAKAGDTVKLLADVEQNSEVAINKSITLDLNGKKIYNTVDIWDATADPVIVSLIDIEDGANVTITGNGAIEAKENDCYTINITKGNLTIENGTFVGNISVVQVANGMLTINGGTFSLLQKDTGSNGDRYLINCIDKAFVDGDAKVAIHGGSFAGFDPNVSPEKEVDGKVPSFAADGVGITKNADGSFTATANMAAQILDSNGNSVEAYDTLAAAIAAANDGETVKLLANVNENITVAVGKNITLDLNGFTIDGGTGTSVATIHNLGTLKITDSGNGGTIKRDDEGREGETSYYVIENHGTMTIEKAIVINNSGYKKQNPSGSMVGSSLIRNGAVDNVSTLTINGGEFTQENFLAIKNDANSVLYVNGGTITSNHSAVQNWCQAELRGGTIRGQLWTDAYKEGESVGNTVIGGSVDYEGEIVMDITGSVKPTLEINGGTLNVTNWKITSACANAGGKPSVSGGTFSNKIPADYCADGFRVAKNGDSYGVVKKYFKASQVTLGTDISFKYIVTENTETVDKVELSYYKVGATEPTVYELTKNGDYYVFSGITPQMIDRKISVTVYVGNSVVYDVVEYSVLDYLLEVLDLHGDTTKNLVASLAYYGKAAMNYVGYETDTVETFITANNLIETTGEISGGVMESGENNEKVAKLVVRFESQNKMLVKVSNDVFANYTYKITVNGKEIENVEWKTDLIDGYHIYDTDGIAARYITDKDHSVAVKVYNKDGEEVQSFEYNIAGYCVKLQNSAKFGEMAKATYNYGVAAAAYAAAQPNA